MRESIRVLHIDDDPEFVDLVSTMLERESDRLAVVTANDASEAIDRLEDDTVDCIVSDYEMPSRTGLELLEDVRETHPDLPFILYTGRGSEAVASEAISAGVTDYLEKTGGSEQYTVLCNRIENAVEQHRASERAETLERIREVVRDVNQALVRSNRRSELETQVCEIITNEGPYEFAWIGKPDSEVESIEPQACEGAGDDSLESISLDDSLTARGPTARAFEEGELIVTQSIADDGAFDPWGETALERGFRSSAAVPLSFEDEQYGVLTVYSSEREPFDDTEKDLLGELGGDIGHALHRIEQERRYRRLFEESVNAIAVHELRTDEDGQPIDYVFLDVNEAFENTTGLEREEVLGERVTDVLPDLDPVFIERYGRVVLADEPVQFDHYTESLDAHYAISAFPLGADRFVTTFNDITTLVERDRELAETNTLLSALLENLPFGVLVENPDREIMAANPAFCEIFDFSVGCEELVGEDCADAAADISDDLQHPQRFIERIEELLANREPTLDEHIEMADGRTLSRSYVPFSMPDGVGDLWLYQDVTAHVDRERELQRTNDRLETVRDQLELALETTNAYTFDWRPEDNEIQRYPTFADVFGIDSATVEPVFDAYFEIVPSDHCERVKQTIQAAIEARTSYDLSYPVCPGDERIWVREQADVLTEDGSVRVVGTVTDVTDLKEYEQRLERQNERLDEFAELISHDLRNPLNVAFGRAELLADDCESDHTQPLLEALERMEAIVGNTLTLARQGDTVGAVKPVPIESIVEECMEMIDAEPATVEVTDGFRIRGDPDRVRHVFENLLSNAVDHATSAGGEEKSSTTDETVTVRIDRLDDRGFYVADDGPGVPNDQREDIFEPGYTTTTEGTGLGLTIVERIAEAHGWDIAVTESRDGGARFEFTGVDIV
ncbi:ATP-binding protein [Halorhabdus rudnickae]|uniref:ATP-binding protein n=1 Tax=Halorhabdus rudnickae TaxID=1775544 RepID=UPI001083C1A7|nr:ATP-binding protein [Halorhabdus rudnickae]